MAKGAPEHATVSYIFRSSVRVPSLSLLAFPTGNNLLVSLARRQRQ